MSDFLLDTNILSEMISARPDQRVGNWVIAQNATALYLSVVTIGELHKGFALLPSGKRRNQLESWFHDDLLPRFQGRILPITYSIAERWGILEALRERMGRPIHVPDAQIAATALEHRLTLVTRNVKDFINLDLAILNPWDMA